MGVQTVRMRGNLGSANTDQGYSPNIWYDCPIQAIRNGEVPGLVYEPDLRNLKPASNVNAAEAYWALGLKAFGSDGAPVAIVDAQDGGITISSDGDNEGASIRQVATPWRISRSHKNFWFEAEIKTSTITDTKHNVFLGLVDATALTATVPITALGALADINLVGFHRTETAAQGAGLNSVYKANGVTAVTVGSQEGTLVADTWTKLGFKFRVKTDSLVHDPNMTNNRKYLMTWFQNNLAFATKYQMASGAGTDFPNDVQMGFAFAVLNATASTPGTSSIRRLRIAQLF